jgi:hypothetical protein
VVLRQKEVLSVVNRYIGVEGGYLGDFSYRTHAEFYPEFCDLDIDPSDYQGTTRERFIAILSSAPPDQQAKILRGVLERFPLESNPSPTRERTAEAIREMIARLESAAAVPSHAPVTTSHVVWQAINDADALLSSGGPTSAVDRVHTMLHGYLRSVCEAANIAHARGDSMTRLLKALRRAHPRLQTRGSRHQDVSRVLNAFAAGLDALDPLRNNASLAHPNAELLAPPEAKLVVNMARTILQYLDERLA